MNVIDETLDRLQESLELFGVVAAVALRKAVDAFNAEPLSLSSVDRFRERVLGIAAHLADPLPDAPGAEVHRIGESRRVDA